MSQAGTSWGSGETGEGENFIFGLSPGAASRYDPTGMSNNYQVSDPAMWPTWGAAGTPDLSIGASGRPGDEATCAGQGTAYEGSSGEVCGVLTDSNWNGDIDERMSTTTFIPRGYSPYSLAQQTPVNDGPEYSGVATCTHGCRGMASSLPDRIHQQSRRLRFPRAICVEWLLGCSWAN